MALVIVTCPADNVFITAGDETDVGWTLMSRPNVARDRPIDRPFPPDAVAVVLPIPSGVVPVPSAVGVSTWRSPSRIRNVPEYPELSPASVRVLVPDLVRLPEPVIGPPMTEAAFPVTLTPVLMISPPNPLMDATVTPAGRKLLKSTVAPAFTVSGAVAGRAVGVP
jgi:hypothetical protein